MAIQNLADLLRIQQELGYYGAGGGKPPEGTQLGEALGNVGQGFGAVNTGIQAGQKTLEGQLMLQRLRQQLAPIGQYYGIPSQPQVTQQVQSTLNQAQNADIPLQDIQSGRLSTMQQGIDTARQQALVGQNQAQAFQTQHGYPSTVPLDIASEIEKNRLLMGRYGYLGAGEKLKEEETKQKIDADNPNSAISISAQDTFKKMFGKDMTGIPKSDIDKFIASGAAGLKVDIGEKTEQDRLESQAINRVSGIRGDVAMSRIEQQRDATIQAADTLKNIKNGTLINSGAVWSDILGQLWRARTGVAPTDPVMKELNDRTAKGDLAGAFTYVTGQAAGKTTEDILNNITTFVNVTGKKLDTMHDSYMTTHLIKPTGLNDDRWQNILKAHRGQSFAESVGSVQTPTPSPAINPLQTPEAHARALAWAQAHPLDPDAQAILKSQQQKGLIK